MLKKRGERIYPENLANIFKRYRNFILYVVIGIWGLVIDLGGFFILYNVFKIDAVIANVISSGVSILNNFFLNAIFNFKKTDKLHRRMISYFSVNGIGLVLSTFAIGFMTDTLDINGNIAKVFTVIVINILQYYFNKKITFK